MKTIGAAVTDELISGSEKEGTMNYESQMYGQRNLDSRGNLINGVECACCHGGRHDQRLHEPQIEVERQPDGRWRWSVGGKHGEAMTKDAAYDRARDFQRTGRA